MFYSSTKVKACILDLLDVFILCPLLYLLRTCQTSGLAAAVAKRVTRRGTSFERDYIDSYVKRWLMSHGRSNRLTTAGETHILT